MKFDYEGIKTSTFLYFTESGVAGLFLLRSGAAELEYEQTGLWNNISLLLGWFQRRPTTAGLCPIMHWAGKTAGLGCQLITSLSASTNNEKQQKKSHLILHQACWHFRSRFTSGGFWGCQRGCSVRGSRGQSRWQACVWKLCASCAFTLITPTITTAPTARSTCKSPSAPSGKI